MEWQTEKLAICARDADADDDGGGGGGNSVFVN